MNMPEPSRLLTRLEQAQKPSRRALPDALPAVHVPTHLPVSAAAHGGDRSGRGSTGRSVLSG